MEKRNKRERMDKRIEIIKSEFENYKVMSYKDFVINLYNALSKEGMHLGGMNTFVEGFVCRDDNQYGKPLILTRRLGLGYPFAGQTFGGYPLLVGRDGLIPPSHHIPNLSDDMNYIILNASHVGLSDKGEWGKAERYNRKEEGPSCGYLMNVLNTSDFDSDNGEMSQIYDVLKHELEGIRSKEHPEVEIAKVVAYKSKGAMDEFIKKVSGKERDINVIYVNGVNVDLYSDPEKDENNVICVDCVKVYRDGEMIKEIEL